MTRPTEPLQIDVPLRPITAKERSTFAKGTRREKRAYAQKVQRDRILDRARCYNNINKARTAKAAAEAAAVDDLDTDIEAPPAPSNPPTTDGPCEDCGYSPKGCKCDD